VTYSISTGRYWTDIAPTAVEALRKAVKLPATGRTVSLPSSPQCRGRPERHAANFYVNGSGRSVARRICLRSIQHRQTNVGTSTSANSAAGVHADGQPRKRPHYAPTSSTIRVLSSAENRRRSPGPRCSLPTGEPWLPWGAPCRYSWCAAQQFVRAGRVLFSRIFVKRRATWCRSNIASRE
jgi:hypothetical protein